MIRPEVKFFIDSPGNHLDRCFKEGLLLLQLLMFTQGAAGAGGQMYGKHSILCGKSAGVRIHQLHDAMGFFREATQRD